MEELRRLTTRLLDLYFEYAFGSKSSAGLNLDMDKDFELWNAEFRFKQVLEQIIRSGNVTEEIRQIIDTRNHGGDTLLMLAAVHGRTQVIKLLAEAGADINIKDNVCEDTPLVTTLLNGRRETALFLISKNADVNAGATDDCYTALHLAVESQDAEMVRLLLEAGAITEPYIEDKNLMLIDAIELGNVEIVKLLLEKCTDVNFVSNLNPLSPLAVAVEKNRIEIIRMLLEREDIRLSAEVFEQIREKFGRPENNEIIRLAEIAMTRQQQVTAAPTIDSASAKRRRDDDGSEDAPRQKASRTDSERILWFNNISYESVKKFL